MSDLDGHSLKMFFTKAVKVLMIHLTLPVIINATGLARSLPSLWIKKQIYPSSKQPRSPAPASVAPGHVPRHLLLTLVLFTPRYALTFRAASQLFSRLPYPRRCCPPISPEHPTISILLPLNRPSLHTQVLIVLPQGTRPSDPSLFPLGDPRGQPLSPTRTLGAVGHGRRLRFLAPHIRPSRRAQEDGRTWVSLGAPGNSPGRAALDGRGKEWESEEESGERETVGADPASAA